VINTTVTNPSDQPDLDPDDHPEEQPDDPNYVNGYWNPQDDDNQSVASTHYSMESPTPMTSPQHFTEPAPEEDREATPPPSPPPANNDLPPSLDTTQNTPWAIKIEPNDSPLDTDLSPENNPEFVTTLVKDDISWQFQPPHQLQRITKQLRNRNVPIFQSWEMIQDLTKTLPTRKRGRPRKDSPAHPLVKMVKIWKAASPE
jgi:hypothetical protein